MPVMMVRCSACAVGESAGLAVQLYSHGSTKNDMLTTSMPVLPGVDQRVDDRLEEEEAGVLAALELDQETFGATPETPMPLAAAPIVPATCVPCAAVVGADRVEAAGHLARAVDVGHVRGEVAATAAS